MDMGPYAAATARLLGSGKLLKMHTSLNKNKQGLIISFNVFCKFEKNYYFGFFCFGGEYKNNMILFSKKKHIELNNIFSLYIHLQLNKSSKPVVQKVLYCILFPFFV